MRISLVLIRLIGGLTGLVLVTSIVVGSVIAKPAFQAGALWQDIVEKNLPQIEVRALQVRAGRYLSLNLPAMRTLLQNAPSEMAENRNARMVTLEIPMPDGSIQPFGIFESPIMAPELAARYPQIRTYAGQGILDRTLSTRLDITPLGFHAVVFTPQEAIYIDPVLQGNTSYYVSYRRVDYLARPGDLFFEPQVETLAGALRTGSEPTISSEQTTVSIGNQLRTYRLALAATGEYTEKFGGTVESGLAAQVVAMNRVNGIYEREVSIRMELIANNDKIIYTDGDTDPYSNDDGIAMLSQNQTNLDSVIGSANYDIGHVFSTGGGGVAYVGVPCEPGYKARGVTGLSNPVGDAFYVDYVAHEMGHQWGAYHTYNGNAGACASGRSALAAYEPGSGSTIMAYAGICDEQDLQANSDAYFHPISFDEIVAYYTTGYYGSTCGVVSPTGNHPPTITSGTGGYTVPINTPFTLVGAASDVDGDALTYTWDEMDLGAVTGPPPPLPGYVVPPYFRSFLPTADPTRTFPRMYDIVNNTHTIGEILPLIPQTLSFRFTVRDNRVGGGGVSHNSYPIQVTNTAGPFLVTAPNTPVSWEGGSQQTVTWNVANTQNAPVNCADVKVDLSTDGGYTYSINLLASTPNDGSEKITVPNIPSISTARVRVACLNHIFFDISDANQTIVGSPDLDLETNLIGDISAGETLTYTIAISNVGWAATSGMITVTDTLATGLLPVSFKGTGWECNLTMLTCSRSDPLPSSSAFPILSLVVTLPEIIPDAFFNKVIVEGGGDLILYNNIDYDLVGAWFELFAPIIRR